MESKEIYNELDMLDQEIKDGANTLEKSKKAMISEIKNVSFYEMTYVPKNKNNTYRKVAIGVISVLLVIAITCFLIT